MARPLIANPKLGPQQGKVYSIDATRFTESDKRTEGLEAGAIDLATSTPNDVISAAEKGVKAKMIASITRESTKGFSTTFYALEDSPIKSVRDLKGKTIGINGFATPGHLWLKSALEKAGLAESDVKIVPTSFPAMEDSLHSGSLDVGQFPQPFAAILENRGKVTKIFTAKDAVPYDEEAVVLIGKDEFSKEKAAAIKAMLEDLRSVTNFYVERPRQARKILLDTKMLRVPADVFLKMKDYYRDPTMRIGIDSLEQIQHVRIKAGFQKNKLDIRSLVDLRYLPN